jgi:tripartite-type tricarboxylate transporter receptor subunit TctC
MSFAAVPPRGTYTDYNRRSFSYGVFANLRLRSDSGRLVVNRPHRRQVLHLAAGAAISPTLPRIARAQAYPSRPVRILVGFPAGGTTDIIARLIGQWLSERLRQQFVIENRPGASANLAAEAAARAPADGYTLLAFTSTNMLNATLSDKLSFSLDRDFAMVAGLNRSPFVLEVHPSVPVKTVPEFIAHAKANPGKITMASFGVGSSSHVAGELFKMMTGIDLVHVPYRGSAPMLIDLIGGQVQVSFDNLPASIEHIRAGRLRPLAVTTATRSDALPDIPTVAEFVPGYEASAMGGIAVPRDTPAAIVEQLNSEINAGLADPRMKARFAELGGMALVQSPVEFTNLVADEIKKWARVVQFAGIRPS